MCYMGNEQTTIGIDQSLNRSGLCVLGGTGNLIVSGLITPKFSLRSDKLIFIRKTLLDMFSKYNPSVVAMEDYSFATKGQAFYLGELGGMIKLLFRQLGCTSYIIPPGLVKKFATGKGNADKNLMLKEVYKRWHKDFDDDNTCDAFVIALLAQSVQKVSKGLTTKSDYLSFQWAAIQDCIKRKVGEF